MGRKTYSFSAVALAAVAGLSFSSVDGAEAFAQDENVTGTIEAVEAEQVEIVPQAPEANGVQAASDQNVTFISEEVVQPVAEPAAPIAGEASSLRELVASIDTDEELTEQMRCLAGAVYFEARGEPLQGQLAVAEVVINRASDSRWPASYCGVVLQRSQFSFVRGGRLPRINTTKKTWARAKAVAKIAHDNLWQTEANDAVYFHANYVSPRWSRKKTRLAQIQTHVFYR